MNERKTGRVHSLDYLSKIGVPPLPPRTSPFDPGYDPVTLESHLAQSHHLISILKISMACWLIANESSTRAKFAAARRYGVPTVTGGGPFEVAVAQGQLEAYLGLCADMGATRVECGEGFTDVAERPRDLVSLIESYGLDVQFEVGKKHGGTFTSDAVDDLIAQGKEWLDAGAKQIVIEGRENAANVGLFDAHGGFDHNAADRFVGELGVDQVVFETPTKASQFAFLNHFGAEVHLCNVRIEELLRVEIYRRGLHSDAFGVAKLRPARPKAVAETETSDR